MAPKKTKKGNLENRKNTFALIGLVFGLGLVYLCFELFATQKNQNNLVFSTQPVEFIPDTQTPLANLTPPPPPPKPEPLKNIIIRITTGKETIDWEKFRNWDIDLDEPNPDPFEEGGGIFSEPIAPPPIYKVPDVMPEYPGGPEAMYAFLSKHLTYPEKAAKIGVQGISFIEFVVEKDGSVSSTTVIAPLYPDCDNEAVRVIKMLKFTPGLVNNKPVRAYYRIPIQFSLQN